MGDRQRERLELIFQWYQGMINPQTGLLEYLFNPETNTFSMSGSPIRDIASVWDVELVSRFLGKQELQPLIRRSLAHYGRYFLRRNGCVILDPRLLGEPSSIAHSAFMILSLLHSQVPGKEENITVLADCIVKQQRQENGSYRVYFAGEMDSGLEFYPAEAMLALMETYELTRDERYLRSVEYGFRYYKSRYYGKNKVASELLVFFANWQSQFCNLLFRHTKEGRLKEEILEYIFGLHDRIIMSNFYNRVEKYPELQSSVEVACGLEGLNDAYSMALDAKDSRSDGYLKCICAGLTYLYKVQCLAGCVEKEKGGFGFSLTNRVQRVDVTGHVSSALLKTLENGIEC